MIFKKFFNSIIALFNGLYTVFKHSFKKRVTLEYPEKKSVLSDRFRGKHIWYVDKCITCKLCEKVCPANAIKINKNSDNVEFSVDLSKCIFCGNCQYYCNREAIKLSLDYELATDNKSDLIIKQKSGEIAESSDNKEVL